MSTRPGNQKKPRTPRPGLINAAQTICKPTRTADKEALHRPDGLADTLPRGQRQRRPKKEAPKPGGVRGAKGCNGRPCSDHPHSDYARPASRASGRAFGRHNKKAPTMARRGRTSAWCARCRGARR